MKEFQLIVIGAGPGGYEAAIRAAQLGLSVGLVENRQVGGTCLNRGCIPTKALLHSAQLYRELSSLELFGVQAEGCSFDFAKIHQRKESVVAQLRTGIEQLLRANKVQLFQGTGSITGPHTVAVSGMEEELHGQHILIATGSKPARPPIPGLELPNVVTSDELLAGDGSSPSHLLYQRLLIIGGGVIGVEFASVYQALGCQVTIVEALDRILPTMDKEISQNLSMILRKRGVEIHTSARVERLEEGEDGLVCHFTEKEKEQCVHADGVLVAIGRRPNTDGLFPTPFAVEMERGRIVTDQQLRTSIESIYAVGDVTAAIQLAHVATAQGLWAVERIAGHSPSIDLTVVPSCIYTNPEIASVGLSEEQAKAQGIPVSKGKFLLSSNGKSLIEAQDRGFVKLLFHAETQVLLGAQLMCARATDLVSELATAMVNGLTRRQLASVIRPHPTFAEAIGEAVEDAVGMAIHMAPKKR